LAGAVHLGLSSVLCGYLYEKLDCTRISNARDALDLRGTVGFFASEESVTGLDEEKSKFPYFSFPLRVGSDGAAKTIRLSEFYRK
jgi:hypothetical protein